MNIEKETLIANKFKEICCEYNIMREEIYSLNYFNIYMLGEMGILKSGELIPRSSVNRVDEYNLTIAQIESVKNHYRIPDIEIYENTIARNLLIDSCSAIEYLLGNLYLLSEFINDEENNLFNKIKELKGKKIIADKYKLLNDIIKNTGSENSINMFEEKKQRLECIFCIRNAFIHNNNKNTNFLKKKIGNVNLGNSPVDLVLNKIYKLEIDAFIRLKSIEVDELVNILRNLMESLIYFLSNYLKSIMSSDENLKITQETASLYYWN